MVSLRDIAKVLDGLSLVAKEGISRSNTVPLETAIKAAVLSVVDVAGLTKGKLRQIDNVHRDTGNDTVIFFTDHVLAPNSHPPPTPGADAIVLLNICSSMDPDSQTSMDVYPPPDALSTFTIYILAALDIVQGANRMPRNQLNQVLDAELDFNWSSNLTSFDYEPMTLSYLVTCTYGSIPSETVQMELVFVLILIVRMEKVKTN
ncbi:PREDICTED: uncharacterized protein LOC105957058 [Erythranthe guttata]|uniref:uncharacterized protein LOC105957058 n=1 Tax=Erythranthe guttata TaxID=4155 RepID=UPI00064E1034|nr:PREDICTED: uncharacterized protein LOC105957058 [Erythranthe guttata]|eukprot:XP_012836433.1 PREDICTED: uncharacterized protein LOC105957058 [Erythranthe guttata]